MSDTLPEREDEMNESERYITSGVFSHEQSDWCKECQGRTHAPWCSEYKAAGTYCICGIPSSSGLCEHSATTHQPAARGGGDESKRYLLAERVQFHRLFVAVKAMRTRHRETAKKSNFNDCGCDDCLLLEPILTAIEHHEQRSTST